MKCIECLDVEACEGCEIELCEFCCIEPDCPRSSTYEGEER